MPYVQLGATSCWYAEAGSGEPVVLLHGGMSDGRAWGAQIGALSASYRALLPDRRGHGRTRDNNEPFSYGEMARETIAFIEAVAGGPARLVGWSDGGIVSLLVARARPDLVVRQVLVGANFHHDGLLDAFDLGDDPEAEALAVLRAMYTEVAADGAGHWPVFLAKTNRLWREEPTLTVEDLRGVATPTLVLAGDDEPIELSHTCQLYEALPKAQLAIVPGTSHMLLLEKPDLVNRLIVEFLAEKEPPATLAPVRRASR